MNSLISDRFLQRFFGRRLYQFTTARAGEVKAKPEEVSINLIEKGDVPFEEKATNKVPLEIKETSESGEQPSSKDGMSQTTNG